MLTLGNYGNNMQSEERRNYDLYWNYNVVSLNSFHLTLFYLRVLFLCTYIKNKSHELIGRLHLYYTGHTRFFLNIYEEEKYGMLWRIVKMFSDHIWNTFLGKQSVLFNYI